MLRACYRVLIDLIFERRCMWLGLRRGAGEREVGALRLEGTDTVSIGV